MTKKCYAAIMSAKEIMSEMEKILKGAKGNVTLAYPAVKECLSKVENWNKDFAECDPNWQPPEKTKQNTELPNSVRALGSFVQQRASA